MKKNLDKHLIGLTGEYLVAGMMSMKGWVASMTLKNYPSIDIFGLNPQTDNTVNIQVKTTKNKKDFQVGLTRQQRDIILDKISCPYVFVHIDLIENVRYFILSREELIDLIELKDDEYFNRPRKTPLKNYPISVHVKDLVHFENNWNNIWN